MSGFSRSNDSDFPQPSASYWEQIRDRTIAVLRSAGEWLGRVVSGNPKSVARDITEGIKVAQVEEEQERRLFSDAERELESVRPLAKAAADLYRSEIDKAYEAKVAAEKEESKERARQEAEVLALKEELAQARAREAIAVQSLVYSQNLSHATAGIKRSDRDEHQPDPANNRKKANARQKGVDVPDAEWAAGAKERKATKKDKISTYTRLVCSEATYPVPWVEKPHPVGCFSAPVKAMAVHAHVVGAGGRFSAVDFTALSAPDILTEIVVAQTPTIRRSGAPPKPLAHATLSKPLDADGKPLDVWSPESANRAARHYLVGLGVDPERHDYAVILHQKNKEEAVHLLWSRIRDDGKLHTCEYQVVAGMVARARWDHAAGLDPGRLETPDGKNKAIRDGFKALRDHKLSARYRDLSGTETDEIVDLYGRDHAACVGDEGAPVQYECAGIWVTKQAYRKPVDVRRIFRHCLMGD